mmetsp:Transcript_60285/g.165193  ORF Transcript_60285/g.165193 Transcript_60285/m.165193 type:complete len:89 (+) Transcript_60285:141-407(+)
MAAITAAQERLSATSLVQVGMGCRSDISVPREIALQPEEITGVGVRIRQAIQQRPQETSPLQIVLLGGASTEALRLSMQVAGLSLPDA